MLRNKRTGNIYFKQRQNYKIQNKMVKFELLFNLKRCKNDAKRAAMRCTLISGSDEIVNGYQFWSPLTNVTHISLEIGEQCQVS